MPVDDVTITRSGLVKAASLVGAVLAALAGAGGLGFVKLSNEQNSHRDAFLETHLTVEDQLRFARLIKENCGCEIDTLDLLWE